MLVVGLEIHQIKAVTSWFVAMKYYYTINALPVLAFLNQIKMHSAAE